MPTPKSNTALPRTDTHIYIHSNAVQSFGEVWTGVLNGVIDVAVKKMYDTANVDTSEDSEIRYDFEATI